VQMWNGLTRRFSSVEADVVAVGAELDVRSSLDDVNKRKQRLLLLSRGIPPLADRAPGDDEGVSGTHGISISNREGKIVLRDPLGLIDVEERPHPAPDSSAAR